MARITDYLQISDALDADRLKPLQFRQQVFDQFKSETDGLRETYLDNQRVPEELSKTRLNNRTNQFRTDDLNQNYGDLLTTSRNNVRFGVGNSQFKLDNQDASQELTLAEQEESLFTTRNRILDAQAENEAGELFRNNPLDRSQDPREYYKGLLRQASTPQLRQRVITQARNTFSPELSYIDSFKQQVERVQRATETRQPGEVNRLKTLIAQTDFQTLEYLRNNNIMSRQQRLDYENMLEVIRETGEYNMSDLLNPVSQQDVPVTPQQTTPVLEQPTTPAPEELGIAPAQVATPTIETSPTDLVNPVIDPETPIVDQLSNPNWERLPSSLKAKYALLTEPLTSDNYEQMDELLGDLLERESGRQILEVLGLNEEAQMQIAGQIQDYRDTVTDRDTQGFTIDDRIALSSIEEITPGFTGLLQQPVTAENWQDFSQALESFTDVEDPVEKADRLDYLTKAGVDTLALQDTIDAYERPEDTQRLDIALNRIPNSFIRSKVDQLLEADINELEPTEAQDLFRVLESDSTIRRLLGFNRVSTKWDQLQSKLQGTE